MSWLVWALVLLAQDCATTILSRAVNSRSLRWHTAAAIFANLIYVVGYLFLVDNLLEVLRSGSILLALAVTIFYVTFATIGSVTSHYISMRWIENGTTRRVG
jgi:hypothetical protein